MQHAHNFPEAAMFAIRNKPKTRMQAEEIFKLVMNELANYCTADLDPIAAIGFKYSMGMYFDMPTLTVGLEKIAPPIPK
jgi:hypothetical protein